MDAAREPDPPGSWQWSQSWLDLLFAHWRVPAAALRPHVPAGLDVDEFGGSAWVSAVPFRMARVRPKWLPAFPPVSDFLELNLRTYVRRAGRAGVYFLSIRAGKRLPAWLARTFSPLPYVYAPMTWEGSGTGFSFRCADAGEPTFAADSRPSSEPFAVSSGSADEWLVERYRLFAAGRRGRLMSAEVRHAPWEIARADAAVTAGPLGRPFGLDLTGPPDCVHASAGVAVRAWPFLAESSDDFAAGPAVKPNARSAGS